MLTVKTKNMSDTLFPPNVYFSRSPTFSEKFSLNLFPMSKPPALQIRIPSQINTLPPVKLHDKLFGRVNAFQPAYFAKNALWAVLPNFLEGHSNYVLGLWIQKLLHISGEAISLHQLKVAENVDEYMDYANSVENKTLRLLENWNCESDLFLSCARSLTVLMENQDLLEQNVCGRLFFPLQVL